MTDSNFDLPAILSEHKLWLSGGGGRRANLRGADLHGAVLSGAVLSRADLHGANLSRADLRDADLRDADLSGAVLIGADMRGADLHGADMRGAVLIGADMRGADLPHFMNCPDTGSFTGWKKLYNGAIAKLIIPEEAGRTSTMVGRKCRAEFAFVASITDINGKEIQSEKSNHDNNFIYTVGETVKPDAYDNDIRVECTNGIHFFITRKEAEQY